MLHQAMRNPEVRNGSDEAIARDHRLTLAQMLACRSKAEGMKLREQPSQVTRDWPSSRGAASAADASLSFCSRAAADDRAGSSGMSADALPGWLGRTLGSGDRDLGAEDSRDAADAALVAEG